MESGAEAGPSPGRREGGPFEPARQEGASGPARPDRPEAGGPSAPVHGESAGREGSGPFGALRCDWPERGEEAGKGLAGAERAPDFSDVRLRRGELQVLKGAGAGVVYEMAVRCFLELGRPAVLIDGGCQADPYEVAAIAKRIGREQAGEGGRGAGEQGMGEGRGRGNGGTNGMAYRGRRVDEDEVLRNIHVARAFTAHQLEALIVERLEPMLNRLHPMFVGVLSLDALFRDDELDRFEARIMQARCLRTLRRLAREYGVMAVATEGGQHRWGATRWW